MQYSGNLYAKVGNKYAKLLKTAEDVDRMQDEISTQSDRIRELEGALENLKHDEFELDEAAQRSSKEYGGGGSFKDGALWMLDWIRKQALRKTEKEPLYPATEESKQGHARAIKERGKTKTKPTGQ